MIPYKELSKEELLEIKSDLDAQFEAIKAKVKEKMEIFGSIDKAWEFVKNHENVTFYNSELLKWTKMFSASCNFQKFVLC